jgi:hypothetical protein
VSDIFISYARQDRLRAEALARELGDHGWSVWWDRTIPPGKSFDRVIEEALDSSKCLIVLWSTSSVISDWVKTEAAEGARRGILIPALIEDVTIPLEFRRIQAANLCAWSPGASNPDFDNLVETVAVHVRGVGTGQHSSEAISTGNPDMAKCVPSPRVGISPTNKWRASLIKSEKRRRTLEVHLTQQTHIVECEYRVGWRDDVFLVKVDGVVAAQKSVTTTEDLITTGVFLDFSLEDQGGVYTSRIEIRKVWFSAGNIKRCRLTVGKQELYTDA